MMASAIFGGSFAAGIESSSGVLAPGALCRGGRIVVFMCV
jgi:hypothetical protein